jgi:hypothetical protein
VKIIKWDRKPISEPGIYSGVPMDAYHGANLCDGPSVSSSGLRKLANQSPAHYFCESPYNPERIEQKETDSLTLGRAAHHLLLGEDDFNTLYIVRPTSGILAHRCRQGVEAGPGGGGPHRPAAEPARRHPRHGAIARRSPADRRRHPQRRDRADHRLEMQGHRRLAKSRPDAIPNDAGDFADLKTTTSVKTDDLARTIAEYGYHQQAALIASGWHAITAKDVASFSFVFVESKPPYCTRIVTLRDDDLARGERQNFVAIKTFAKCMETGEWPGPGGADAEYLALPTWAQTRIDHQLELAEAS